MAYALTDSDKTKLDWAIRYLAVSSAPQGDHAAFITEEVAKVVAPVAVNSGLYATEGKFLEEVAEAPVLTLLRLVRHVGD
jgi:hypothetical protein